MLCEKMEQALNTHVTAELYSAYLYLSMESYLHETGLSGFANWMRMQAQEELMHAMKMYDFIVSRGGRPRLAAIECPPREWDSVLAVFENALEHEQHVTALINKLVDLAIEEKDHATKIFLQWYVTEQIEEEESAGDIVSKLRLVGSEGQGIFSLDQEMGQRSFTPPTEE